MPSPRVLAAAAAVILIGAVPAMGQQSPPPDGTAPTDIGRTSTKGREGPEEVVMPSATTNRAAALEEKKEAPNIIEVQPLSEIIKLPDINMAEALQRIPGISLETDTGEGRFINIRGLDSDLNGTTYGGVRLPASNPSSPFGGARATAFDTFPTGIVGGVEVTKTLRPDWDAEALGGTINLVPRTGAEHGGEPFLDTDFGYGDEPLRGTPVYHAEFSAGRGFDGGDGLGGWFAGPNALSAVLTAVYHQDKRGIDDVEEAYTDQQSSGVPDKVLSDLQFRRYEYARDRYGAAANFDAKPAENTSLYLRLLYSGYLERAQKHYLVLNGLDSNAGCTPLPSCIQDPSNPNGYQANVPAAPPGSGNTPGLEQDSSDSLERIQNTLAMVGGSTDFSTFKLDYRASYALGTDLVSSQAGSTSYDYNAVTIDYDNNTNPNYPSFSTPGVNSANPGNYVLNNISLGSSYAHDGETAGTLDATIPMATGDGTGQLKFGLSLRDRHKTNDSYNPVFTPTGTISLSSFTYGPGQIYYGNRYDIGPAINYPAVIGISNSSLGTIADDPAADASTDTDNRENVYASYGQFTARYGKWGVLAGLRVESTHARYGGNLYDADSDVNTPTAVKTSYTNYFPTLQGRYDILNNLVARATYSSGIARPGFDQIDPGATISVTAATVSVGNPTLKPTIGQDFDLTLEYYPGDGQIAAAGLFYKDFKNYILPSQQFVNGYPFPGLTTAITTVTSYSNGPAHADGFEAQYQQQLTFLPAPLNGFGYSGNVTLVDSRSQIHPGVYGLLPSTSKLTWNAAIFYERSPVEIRVAADYVGQNLFAFGSGPGNSTDDYSSARLTLDLGASYTVLRQVKVYFDAKNLLNTPLEFTEGPSQSRPIQREYYDITLMAGVRVSL
jgi:TonB-dependent receptor